jgi:hypothetical protein
LYAQGRSSKVRSGAGLRSNGLIFPIISYQTSSGVVNGIQWVPAESTSTLPAGAVPASAVSVFCIEAMIFAKSHRSLFYPGFCSLLESGPQRG